MENVAEKIRKLLAKASSNNEHEASAALLKFTPQHTLRFFSDLGLLTTVEPDGRVYPLSDSSNSVLDVLRFALDQAGVEQRCSFSVDSISRTSKSFLIESGTEHLRSDAVILACGGAAGSRLGGVTDGYRLGEISRPPADRPLPLADPHSYRHGLSPLVKGHPCGSPSPSYEKRAYPC